MKKTGAVTELLPSVVLAAMRAAFPATGGGATSPKPRSGEHLSAEQRDFMKWRFGVFIHFNLGTFADRAGRAATRTPRSSSPRSCGQWADVAREAGMSYLVLTVKHTEGIALYDSALTTHDATMFRNFRGGRGDVVREFVDACRSHGWKPTGRSTSSGSTSTRTSTRARGGRRSGRT